MIREYELRESSATASITLVCVETEWISSRKKAAPNHLHDKASEYLSVQSDKNKWLKSADHQWLLSLAEYPNPCFWESVCFLFLLLSSK